MGVLGVQSFFSFLGIATGRILNTSASFFSMVLLMLTILRTCQGTPLLPARPSPFLSQTRDVVISWSDFSLGVNPNKGDKK
jgi:hypothetical protein